MTFRETDGGVVIRAIDLGHDVLVAAFAAPAYPRLCLDACGGCVGAVVRSTLLGRSEHEMSRVFFEFEAMACRYRFREEVPTVRVFDFCRNGEDAWRPLPMRRALRSWWESISADWPPYQVSLFGHMDGALQIDFEDVLIPDEHSILQRWREARWRARRSARGRWVVTRLGYVESKYESQKRLPQARTRRR